ncbi:hypothetical protein SPRG_06119 [Saprolegnia parasitica CBS 223.65]|uniref:Uncharacterized protein n=1 Tax=Saprolegnia parasitica (strain CBS 223.65) TaxID=695850 RepID=A0A067CE81_SAPPC|nr:hypothetical protein SPRG_06119 [Saprolegnia parasitica CBS 223.65]KDO29064.1 hypothetical protein SPRG_06119 [Saprolegnia parasitica CBS 223.65]|eukprot:XP_012200234.1 hypothetical protein SPRG_06119 [Saprolegnia parasitica CBS 223.65]
MVSMISRFRLPRDLKTLSWRFEHPFRWSTIRNLVFHPFNWALSTLSLVLVLGSVLSHLSFYALTTLKFGLEENSSEVDITIPHSIKHAATTDLVVHEYFQLERNEDDSSAMAGVDLRLKYTIAHSKASFEVYLAVLYFVSLKPIVATVFFTLGPILLLSTLISIFQPGPSDVALFVSLIETYGGVALSSEEEAWIAGSQHVFLVLFSLIVTEFSAAVSHDLMRLFCCEWRIVYDEDHENQVASESTPLLL